MKCTQAQRINAVLNATLPPMEQNGLVLISSILLLMLSGCQVSSPVQPVGKDTYMVSSHVSGCISCSASIQSLETANEYCTK